MKLLNEKYRGQTQIRHNMVFQIRQEKHINNDINILQVSSATKQLSRIDQKYGTPSSWQGNIPGHPLGIDPGPPYIKTLAKLTSHFPKFR